MEFEEIIKILKIRLKNNEISKEEYQKFVSIAESEKKYIIVPKVDLKFKKEVVGSNFLEESRVWYVKAEKLFVQKRIHEALQTVEKSIDVHPEYIPAWELKAKILQEIERYEEAVYTYNKILSIKPGETSALINKGIILNIIGRHKDANLCFSEVSQIKKSMQIDQCRKILQEYHRTHTYLANDIYVCGDMACDVWDILKTKGINARIAIGNPEIKVNHIFESNHAWVIAEIGENNWKNFETTIGEIIENNNFYNNRFVFETPKEFKEYVRLLKQFNEYVSKYNELVNNCNTSRLSFTVDDADDYAKLAIINEKKRDIAEVISKMQCLIMTG